MNEIQLIVEGNGMCWHHHGVL